MTFNVHITPSGVNFKTENNLLSDALSQSVILEHSCKSGSCGICRAELIEGEVEDEIGNNTVKSGSILTCCSRAKSDLILKANYYPQLSDIKVRTIPCKVTSFDYVTDDILVIRFRFPLTIDFNYLPGQYIDLSFQGLRRSYSIANAKNSSNEVEFYIRKVPDGKMSNILFSNLKENELMRMEGPKGTFFVRDNNKPLIFIATGTGIAPIRAMVEELVQSGDKREVFIYWGMRNYQEFYKTGIDILVKNYPHIHFMPVFSREAEWNGHKGYVQDAVLNDFISIEQHEVYASGSLDMINTAKTLFLQNGLPPKAFYSDAFIPAK